MDGDGVEHVSARAIDAHHDLAAQCLNRIVKRLRRGAPESDFIVDENLVWCAFGGGCADVVKLIQGCSSCWD